jgi:hypothetical protein
MAATDNADRSEISVIGIRDRLTPFLRLANSERWSDHALRKAFDQIEKIVTGTNNTFPWTQSETLRLRLVVQGIRKTLKQLAIAGREHKGLVEVPLNVPVLDCLLIHAEDGQYHEGEIEIIPMDRAGALYQFFLDVLGRLDAARIRHCPVCSRIYWAVRRDAGVCSASCRVKRWQKHSPQRWKEIQEKHERKRARLRCRERRHVTAVNVDSLVCNHCGYQATKRSDFAQHKQTHKTTKVHVNKQRAIEKKELTR